MIYVKGDKMLKELLKERNLPELKTREDMLEILLEEEYGHLPPKPEKIDWEVKEKVIPNFCAGKAIAYKIIAKLTVCGKEFSFPFYATIPTENKKYPFFIHINFRDNVPDRYMPTEELVDNGFAILSFCYEDVTKDNYDFTDGLSGVLFDNGNRKPNDPGKIVMWAWAAHRVMDYAQTLGDVLDLERSIVCGHSRLGKTALLTAATDDRFKFAYSNDSGCSGAAITRQKGGENIEKICNKFGYWFCENYYKYVNNENKLPFDQHYLVSSIAPRFVCIGSASEDLWADPVSEMLNCIASSSAFTNGFIYEDRLPEIGDAFFDGDIGYHLRKGLHYFSRADWLRLIEFVNKH